MKVKFKLAKKVYIDLIRYIAAMDLHDLDFNLEFTDLINVHTLHADAISKFLKWRSEPLYNAGKKEFTIPMEINCFYTLQKIGWRAPIGSYESSVLIIMHRQAQPQIETFMILNKLKIDRQ